MAFDSFLGRTILFGGYTDGGFEALGDTWEWYSGSWAQRKPNTSPPRRGHLAMAYDSVRKRMVLFGGSGGYWNPLGDTWEWDGSNWAAVPPPKVSPSARFGAKMAYGPNDKSLLLFGGITGLSGSRPTGESWLRAVGLSQTLGLTTDLSTVSIAIGGAQRFTLTAGSQHASRLYWIFGSMTGTTPGVTLSSQAGSVNIPLNPDPWTDYTIASPNTAALVNTRAALDQSGNAYAALYVPKISRPGALGLVFFHAYLVYDAQNNLYGASNPVPLLLVK